MSKDILTALIFLLIGLILWDVSEALHKDQPNSLPPDVSSYLQEVNPGLDTQTLELLQLDHNAVGS